MKKIFLGLFLLFTSMNVFAQTNYNVGAIRGTTSDNTTLTRMNFDNYDYHIAYGKFKDSVNVNALSGSFTLYGGSSTIHNSYFAAYDDLGYLIFAHKLGNATDSVNIKSAKVDFTGKYLVCGSFKGTVDFADNAGSPFYLSSTGSSSDGFVAYYDYSGNLINAIILDGVSNYASVNDVTTNMNGGIVVTGAFLGTMDADGSGLTNNINSTAGYDGFIATYDNTLNFISAVVIEGTGNQLPNTIITDWNNIIVGGTFDLQIALDLATGGNIVSSNGGKDVFMIYTDDLYNTINSIAVGGPGAENLKDLRFDSFQGYYCLIDFEQTVNFNPNFGTDTKTSNGSSDVAVVRYASDFSLGYVKQFGNSNTDLGYRLVQNSSGMARGGPPISYPEDHSILTMGFSGALDINPDPTETLIINSSNTAMNSAIINLDSSGHYVNHGVIEATSIVGIKPTGFNGTTVIMAGNFSGTSVDLLPYSEVLALTHTGANSGFYMNYNRCQITASEPYIVEPYECGTCNVKLTVDNVQGGFPPYSFNWSNGDNYSYEQIGTGLCPDNMNYYNLYIDDFYGCGYGDTIWVKGYDTLPSLDMNLNVTNTTCGNNFGSANVTPINNLGTVSYLWSNGSTTATADSLTAGNYFIQLIDDSLTCYYEKNFFIDNSDGPTISLNSAVDPACGNVDNGSINVDVSGGTAPYTFHWTNGATTEDLTGVGGGTYTLTVTDATGCENSLCITLYQPSEIYAYRTNTFYSSCNSNTGALTIEASGGYAPYTYQWDANAGSSINDTVNNLFAGIYNVTVTDSLGCTANMNFAVTDGEWYSPAVGYNYITNPNCLGNSGYIDVYAYAYSPLQIMDFLWDSGETTQSLTNATSGTHYLQVTDETGCRTVAEFWVYQELPVAPTVCMVTVDSTGTQNVVVWDNSTTQEAEYYNIYREGFCNQNDFGIVGTVSFDSLSVFYDTVVNSDTRTWRYYVTAVDTCGFESDGSTIHRTIHLTSVLDASVDAVLDWTEYVGMDILGYKIYRRQPSGLLYDLVDSVGPNTTNYLDTINFSAYTELEYFVDAIPMTVCNASRAYNQNEARSNHSKNLVPVDTTLTTPEVFIESSFELYPNPSNDLVNIKVNSQSKNWKLQLLDQTGRLVLSGVLQDKTAFSTKDIADGVYFIRLTSDKNEMHTLKLMIVH